jgi:hypothetical protein
MFRVLRMTKARPGVLPNGSTSAVSHVAAVKKTDQDGLFMA